jgi:hypothetical protein
MSDGFIRVPTDSTGKKVDAEELLIGANTVERQRVQIPTFNPQTNRQTSSNLSAGANVDLDATLITNTKVGKLAGIDVASSIPFKCDIQTVSGSRTTHTTVIASASRTVAWRPPNIDYVALTGNGTTARFGVSITNLDTSEPADVYATFYWEEY